MPKMCKFTSGAEAVYVNPARVAYVRTTDRVHTKATRIFLSG